MNKKSKVGNREKRLSQDPGAVVLKELEARAMLQPLPREEIAPYINWHISRAGLDREIFAPAAVDLLAEASEGNPRTLNLLAQAAWITAARLGESSISAAHGWRIQPPQDSPKAPPTGSFQAPTITRAAPASPTSFLASIISQDAPTTGGITAPRTPAISTNSPPAGWIPSCSPSISTVTSSTTRQLTPGPTTRSRPMPCAGPSLSATP